MSRPGAHLRGAHRLLGLAGPAALVLALAVSGMATAPRAQAAGRAVVEPDPGIRSARGISSPRYLPARKGSRVFVNGPSGKDVQQGMLAQTCFLLVAASSVAKTDPRHLEQLITARPDGNFDVRLYRKTRGTRGFHPVKVVVKPDLLVVDTKVWTSRSSAPVTTAVLAKSASRNRRELWVGLLEKAYAKLHGGYGKLEGGSLERGMSSITGRPTTRLVLAGATNHTASVLKKIKAAVREGRPIVASTFLIGKRGPSRKLRAAIGGDAYPAVGLMNGHAYTIWGYEHRDGRDYVVLRNPAVGLEPAPGTQGGLRRGDGIFRLEARRFAELFEDVVISR